MTRLKRLLMRLGKCPYCGRHYLPPSELLDHLQWAHFSKRREWDKP